MATPLGSEPWFSVYPWLIHLPSLSGGIRRNGRPIAKAFPQYGIINNRLESEGQSFYNAGKVDVTRRFAQGIQAGLSYTFAKLITDAGEDIFGDSPLNGVVQNPL